MSKNQVIPKDKQITSFSIQKGSALAAVIAGRNVTQLIQSSAEHAGKADELLDGYEQEQTQAGKEMLVAFLVTMADAGIDVPTEPDAFKGWYDYARKTPWYDALREAGVSREAATRTMTWVLNLAAAKGRRETENARKLSDYHAEKKAENHGGNFRHDSAPAATPARTLPARREDGPDISMKRTADMARARLDRLFLRLPRRTTDWATVAEILNKAADRLEAL